MTTVQLLLMVGFYFVLFIAVSYFTRATTRRNLGALAGGAVFGLVGVFGVAVGETEGWWRIPQGGVANFQILLWLGFAISCTPSYLLMWRVVRRFDTWGVAVCIAVSTIIGPPRDYMIAATFPAWMTFSPGIAPILADAAFYALLPIVGYAVMRWIAGPASADILARQPSSSGQGSQKA